MTLATSTGPLLMYDHGKMDGADKIGVNCSRGASNCPGTQEGFPRCRTSGEAVLSFVLDTEQRLWRIVTRRKYQLTRNHVRLQNQLEGLLEECHIKLSSLVSDLLAASARRMLKR
jgi:hypothetical protein